MPPVMGATAFIMANFLETSYANVALAAIIPSFLYFFGLFIQIDARAATEKLKGLDKKELPSLSQTLREGWYYIFAFGLLVYLLLFLRREMLAPFYATPLLILINQIFSPKTRWPASSTGTMASALCVFETAITVTSSGTRLFRRASSDSSALMSCKRSGAVFSDVFSI